MKRLTEAAQLALSSNTASLQAEFETRRIEETRQLLNLKRTADVDFQGDVSAAAGTVWLVAGLPLNVPMNTPGAAGTRAGDRVEVKAYTTDQGELFARTVRLIEPGQHKPIPTITAVPTHPIATGTANPPLPSSTPTLSATPQPSSTPTSTSTPTLTSTSTLTTVTGCVPAPPSGWTVYTIQAGDTLSAISAARRVSLEEVIRANCITNTRLIVAGQQLYLPSGPDPVRLTPVTTQISGPVQPTAGGNKPPIQVEPPSNDNSSDDNGSDHSGNDDGNDNSDDHAGSDDNNDSSGHGGGNDNN
jgi:LysM repeat protein